MIVLLRTAAIILLLSMAAACAPATVPREPAPTPTTETGGPHLIIAAVPAGQEALAQEVRHCQERIPGLEVDIRLAGLYQAQETIAAGAADLALLDQPPAPFYQGVLTATHLADEPIAIIVHPDNPLGDLSRTALIELLSGRARDWSQIGGDAGPVQVYLPPESAGEARLLESALAGSPPAGSALVRSSADSVRQAVAADRGGIGILPASTVTAAVAVLRIDGMLPSAVDYPWKMPLLLVVGPHSPPAALELVACLTRTAGP